MPRYRPFPRRQLRALFRAWTKRNRKQVLLVTLLTIALIALETFLLLGLGERAAWKWYVLGALHVAIAAAWLGGLIAAFVTHERSALSQIRGAWGEDNTRDELKRARRKGVIWGWVDSVTLRTGDIDHLVVTREGGLVAIDSKWRNEFDWADRDRMAHSARRAGVRAEGVVRSAVAPSRALSNAEGVKTLAVRPVVVVWGALRHEIPPDACHDGVHFVSGSRLIRWLSALEGRSITRGDAKDTLRGLEHLRASAWSTSIGSR